MISTSDQINDLAKAMTGAQAAMRKAGKDGKNPHFRSRYATLESVWDACREPLTANGLSIVQAPSCESGRVIITTRILHVSGQWIESSLSLRPMKDDAQAIGSAITYGKRYALMAMAGIADDDDDDGDAAVKPPPPPQPVRRENLIDFAASGHADLFKKIALPITGDDYDQLRMLSKHAIQSKMTFNDFEAYLKQLQEEG